MVKNKLKLIEIMTLSEEIHGLIDNQSGSRIKSGLLDEKISLVQKYWLSDLGKKIKEVSDGIDPLRTSLFSKYGESQPDGSMGISAIIEEKNENGETISKKENPNWESFNKEYTELMSQEREIEHYEFRLNDFAEIKTENRYSIFQKLLNP